MNSTIHTTLASPTPDLDPGITWRRILLGVVLSGLVVVTLVANVLVVVVVAKNKRLQTVFNAFIVNLAVTDMAVAVTMSFFVVLKVLQRWPFGQLWCGVWLFSDFGMRLCSVFTLVVIAMDRYWSVHWSNRYRLHNNQRKAAILIAAVWCVGVSLFIKQTIKRGPGSRRGPYLSAGVSSTPFSATTRRISASVSGATTDYVTDRTTELKSEGPTDSSSDYISSTVGPSAATRKYWDLFTLSPQPDGDVDQESISSSESFEASTGTLMEETFLSTSRRSRESIAQDSNYSSTSHQPSLAQNLNCSSVPRRVSMDLAQNSSFSSMSLEPSLISAQDTSFSTTSLHPSLSLAQDTSFSTTFLEPSRSEKKSQAAVGFTSPGGILYNIPQDDSTAMSRSFYCSLQADPTSSLHTVSFIPGHSGMNSSDPRIASLLSATDGKTANLPNSGFPFKRVSDAGRERAAFDTRSRSTEGKTSYLGSEQQTSRERKAFMTLIFIMIGYLSCWMPFQVTFVLMAIDSSLVPAWLYDVTHWLSYSNSTINPFFYGFGNLEFRKALGRMFCCNRRP